MGALDYLSHFCTLTESTKDYFSPAVIGKKSSRRKAYQTVEIKVKMDCDGCERRVRNALKNMKGVKSLEVDRKIHRVRVTGYVDPKKVLRKVKSTGKTRAEYWPYIEQHLVSYPYAQQAYDKRAPSGFVKNVIQAVPTSHDEPEEKFAHFFSDDNTNACIIM